MNKPVVAPVPVAKTLAEQKSDFTAEGAPSPGKVSTSTPVDSPAPDKGTPAKHSVRATITLKRIAARASL
jgi:hypothetical protein